MSDASKAVFLSYASQDAEAVERIATALRAAGVDVWFDKSELTGGDAWDAKIRRQIADCALFVPVISAATQARHEGYFRLEWKLAAQRTHMMSGVRAFLLPVVIDGTRDAEAHVPDEFRAVQWTRLPAGETPLAFCERVKKLLSGEAAAPGSEGGARLVRAQEDGRGRAAPLRKPSRPWLVPAISAVAAVAALAFWQPWRKSASDPVTVQSVAPPTSEAQQLVAKVWVELERIHLDPPILTTAEGLARRAAGLEPLNPDVWAAWSQVDSWFGYLQYDTTAQRIESARTNAEHALRLAPNSFEARLAQAVYLVRARGEVTLPPNPEQAEALLNELLKERPEDRRALFAAAILERNLKHWPEARALFGRLAQIPRFEAEAWAELGYAEQRAGDPVAAEAAADRSIQLQPYATNLTLKLYLAMVRGDLNTAEATLNRVPADIAEGDKVVSIAARIEHMRRDSKAMLKRLEPIAREWLSSVDYDGPIALWIGRAREMAGQPDAARFQWELGLKLVERRLVANPSSGALIKWKGIFLALLGQKDESEKFLKLASEMRVGSREGPPAAVWVHARIRNGQIDAVLDQMERQPGSFNFTAGAYRFDPFYDELRVNPRFQALIAKVQKEAAANIPAAPEGTLSVAEKSVAVLAFADNSPGHDSEYFSDGISDELILALGKVPGLKVPGGTSSFYFKGKQVPTPEIARQLGVAYVIEGSVVRIGEKVKISARLIKAADGFQEWQDSFQRDAKDVFAVEEEIAGLIAKKLSLKLGVSSAAATASVNPEAFELYVRARGAWNSRTAEGFDQAEQLLQRVLVLEPKFARAHAALADVWAQRLWRSPAANQADAKSGGHERARIKAKITDAIRFDRDSAEAHASLGDLLSHDGKNAEAESALRRAVTLNPNLAVAHQWLGWVLLNSGNIDEALKHLQRATELDPLAPIVWSFYGSGLRCAGRYAESLFAADRALALKPDEGQAVWGKVINLAALGRSAEAVELVRSLPSDRGLVGASQLFAFARAGLRADAETLLGQRGSSRYWAAGLIALGQTDEAMALLSSQWFHLYFAADFLWDPIYDSLRNDPRWAKFIADLGLSEAHARAQAWRKAHPPEKPVAK